MINENDQMKQMLVSVKTEVLELKEFMSDNYVNKSELDNYLPLYYKDKFISSSDVVGVYQSIEDSKKIYSELNSLIKEKVSNSELSNYIKKGDFTTFVTKVNKDISNLRNNLNKISFDNIYTKDEIDNIGFLTEHQSLDEYVKKSDIILSKYVEKNDLQFLLTNYVKNVSLDEYVKKTDIGSFITLDDVNKIIDNISFEDNNSVTIDYIKEYTKDFIKKSDADKLYITLKELPSTFDNFVKYEDIEIYINNTVNKNDLYDYVKKSDLLPYVKETELPKDYVKKGDLDLYLKKSDISKYNIANKSDLLSYIRKSDISNFGFLTEHQSLDNYATKTELYNYVRKTELPNLESYAKKQEVYNLERNINTSLFCYIKKEELNEYIKSDEVDKKINNIKFPDLTYYATKTELSNYINDIELESFLKPYAKKSDLNSYVKNDKLFLYVTKSEIENVYFDKYAKKTDLESYIKKSYIDNLDIVYKDNLKDFVKKTDIEDISNINIPDLSNFIKREDLYDYVRETELPDLSPYAKKKELNVYVKYSDLVNYYTKSEMISICSEKFIKKSDINQYIEKIDESLYLKKTDASDTYLKKNEIDITGYMTKYDCDQIYLTREDYRGIKDAMTFNTAYNDNYTEFFDLASDTYNYKSLMDGFYLVDNKVLLVKNGSVCDIEDNSLPCWKIENE